MEWSDLGRVLKDYGMPIIGSLSGNPAAMAALGSQIFKDVNGVDEKDPKSIADYVKTLDPEEVKRLDQEYELEVLRLLNADRLDARNLAIQTLKQTGKQDPVQLTVAVTSVLGFIALVFVLVFVPLNPGTSQLLIGLAGLLAGHAGQVVTFYFGSSKGSSDKNKMLSANKS